MRKKLTPRIFTLTSSASTSAKPTAPARRRPRRQACCAATSRTAGRWKSRTKLSSPMNCAGRGEISRALVNARTNARHDRDEEEREQQDRRRATMQRARSSRRERCGSLRAPPSACVARGCGRRISGRRAARCGHAWVSLRCEPCGRRASASAPLRPRASATGSSCWTSGWRRCP